MSAILAVCGTAFCAMVSDGRMVEEPITDGKIKVLTDALPKVRKLNRNVLVGFAGDAVAAAQIINKLDEYDVQYMTLEKAVKVLQQAAQQTPCAPVGVRLLVGGRGRKGDFQLVMLASASSAVALYRRGDAWAYLRPQLLYAALGLCGMWLASRVDYHIFHKLAWPLLGLSLILLAAVLFMPEYNGCKRWLVIPGFGTLQPSEIAKFAVVLVFSHIIALNHDRMKDFSVGVLPFALVLGVVAALMLLEPHLSGTVLILGIGAVLMFVGGTGLRWFLLAGAGGVGAIGAAVAVMPDLVPYAADRLRSWLDPFADPLGDGHQTIQSLYAIGSGGATGLGLGESRQKHLFVPEPQNDFIFSIVCEELGFVGACAVVGLFVLLLCRGITIAAHAPDRFGALLVVGFVVQVALQAVLNVAVVTNTIPNTGISLPFFSSGGTSLMMLLGEMGVVLGVSRGS